MIKSQIPPLTSELTSVPGAFIAQCMKGFFIILPENEKHYTEVCWQPC